MVALCYISILFDLVKMFNFKFFLLNACSSSYDLG